MIYNYEKLKSEYTNYKKHAEELCGELYDMNLSELRSLYRKTDRQKEFLDSYNNNIQVNINECLVNKIAWIFENEFSSIKKYELKEYDKENLKTDKKYTHRLYIEVETLKKEYDLSVKMSIKKTNTNQNGSDYETNDIKSVISNDFKKRIKELCPDEELLCNVIVDMCYKNEKSKQFMWELCGKQIINNLLAKNNNRLSFPKQDINGNIEFKGEIFSMTEVTI